MQVTEEMVNVPPGGDEAPMNQLDPMDAPVPGQSLTSDPSNMPYESPPDITDPQQAVSEIILVLEDPRTKKDILSVLATGFPVEAMVHSFVLAGVAEGKFSVDVAEIAKPVLALYIIKMGLENNIPVVPFTDKVLSEEEEDIIRDEETLENMEETAPDKARFIRGEMFMEDFEGLANEEKSRMDAREKIRAKEAEMPAVESDGSFLELGGE